MGVSLIRGSYLILPVSHSSFDRLTNTKRPPAPPPVNVYIQCLNTALSACYRLAQLTLSKVNTIMCSLGSASWLLGRHVCSVIRACQVSGGVCVCKRMRPKPRNYASSAALRRRNWISPKYLSKSSWLFSLHPEPRVYSFFLSFFFLFFLLPLSAAHGARPKRLLHN